MPWLKPCSRVLFRSKSRRLATPQVSHVFGTAGMCVRPTHHATEVHAPSNAQTNKHHHSNAHRKWHGLKGIDSYTNHTHTHSAKRTFIMTGASAARSRTPVCSHRCCCCCCWDRWLSYTDVVVPDRWPPCSASDDMWRCPSPPECGTVAVGSSHSVSGQSSVPRAECPLRTVVLSSTEARRSHGGERSAEARPPPPPPPPLTGCCCCSPKGQQDALLDGGGIVPLPSRPPSKFPSPP